MAMNVGSGSSGDPEVMIDINTTPLIDVMLVLLVMLIITIPIQTHAVKLNMPVGNPPPPLVAPEVITVEVDFDGTLLWNGQVLSGRADLENRLRDAVAQPVQPVGKATTAQEEAFELVAKGRALTAQRGGSLLAARECFERAILLSPDNADAHAAPGETLVSLVRYGLLPVSEGRPLAKAATRALEFEPTLAEAMGALASEATRAVAEDPLSLACAALHSIAL